MLCRLRAVDPENFVHLHCARSGKIGGPRSHTRKSVVARQAAVTHTPVLTLTLHRQLTYPDPSCQSFDWPTPPEERKAQCKNVEEIHDNAWGAGVTFSSLMVSKMGFSRPSASLVCAKREKSAHTVYIGDTRCIAPNPQGWHGSPRQ